MANVTKKRSSERRKQTGIRLPEDTLRAIAIRAAEQGMTKWALTDKLLREHRLLRDLLTGQD